MRLAWTAQLVLMASADGKSRGGEHERTFWAYSQQAGLTVTAPPSSSWRQYRRAAQPRWLPPGGIGNGLGADTWTVLVDADAGQLILLLDALAEAGIAAYAARLDRMGRRVPSPVFRIWVDTWTHAHAEDVIRKELLRSRRPWR